MTPQHRPASDIADLIAKVEAATHANYALEVEIAQALGLPDHPPRAFTASIEAALSLMPEGWDWKVISRTHAPYHGRWPYEAVADKGDLRLVIQHRMFAGFAMTAPLALCIAALRARQAAS